SSAAEAPVVDVAATATVDVARSDPRIAPRRRFRRWCGTFMLPPSGMRGARLGGCWDLVHRDDGVVTHGADGRWGGVRMDAGHAMPRLELVQRRHRRAALCGCQRAERGEPTAGECSAVDDVGECVGAQPRTALLDG